MKLQIFKSFGVVTSAAITVCRIYVDIYADPVINYVVYIILYFQEIT